MNDEKPTPCAWCGKQPGPLKTDEHCLTCWTIDCPGNVICTENFEWDFYQQRFVEHRLSLIRRVARDAWLGETRVADGRRSAFEDWLEGYIKREGWKDAPQAEKEK